MDPNSPAAGVPTGTPTPPSSPAAPTVPTSTPSPDAANGHVTAADFEDPTWGKKLKNLHDGMHEKATRLSATETDLKGAREQYARAMAFLQDPKNAPQIRAYLDRIAPSQTNGAPSNPEPTDDEKRFESFREEQTRNQQIEQAMFETYFTLGNGDVEKGRTAWSEQAEDVNKILGLMGSRDPRDQLNLALEVLRARRAPSSPPPPPDGTAAGEPGRGQPSGVQPPAKISNWRDMLAAAGMTPAQYMAETGAFGR